MDRPAFTEANGISMRYQLSGAGPRTVVLLHEMSSLLECWDDIAPALEADHQVLRYDARGFGLSEKVWPASFDELVADLRGLIDTLALQGPFTLVGSAMGGATALAFAARYPDEVRGVMSMAPAINMNPQAVQASMHDAPKPATPLTMRQIIDARMDVLYNPAIRTPERLAKFRALHLASNGLVTGAVLKMMGESDFRPILPKVTCPVLIVAAGLYAQRSPEATRLVADAIPGARFEVLATDHIMTVQSPELVLPLLQSFLKDIDG